MYNRCGDFAAKDLVELSLQPVNVLLEIRRLT